MIKNSDQCKNFAYDWHRAGIKSQELFKKQAKENEYILEELSQDQDSFKAYTGIKEEYLKIKRGNFLIRNALNIEVDVKCRRFITTKHNSDKCFEFNDEELTRHLNMQAFTQTPIVIAIYERDKCQDRLIEGSLIMMDVAHMKKLIERLKLKKMRSKGKNLEIYYSYQIPVNRTMKGFRLINYLALNY